MIWVEKLRDWLWIWANETYGPAAVVIVGVLFCYFKRDVKGLRELIRSKEEKLMEILKGIHEKLNIILSRI